MRRCRSLLRSPRPLLLAFPFVLLLLALLHESSMVPSDSLRLDSRHLSEVLPLSLEGREGRRRSRDTGRRLPRTLLIGVRKAGTRALLDAVALHPQVKAARREVHFFDDESNYEKGVEWYRQQMPRSVEGEIVMEKTPAYFTSPLVPKRVHQLNPGMKMILIVREPVSRAVSDFTQVYYNREETNKSLPVFRNLAFTNHSTLDINYKPVRNSLYAVHLRRWLAFFPLHQFLILDGDLFAKDPLSQLRLVESFLGLSPSISPTQLVFNPSKGFHCFRRSLSSSPRCLGRSKGRPHVSIGPSSSLALRRLLRPHNQRFFHLINRIFPW